MVAPVDDKRSRAYRERREQLLDAAGQVLVARGLAGFTMEGLAEAAGVSKALPYRHFANADEAVVALYRREIGNLDERVSQAAQTEQEGDRKIVAAVRAYFEFVAERGQLLGVLAGTGSAVPVMAEGKRPAPDVAVQIVQDAYPVETWVAEVLGALVNGIATAGAEGIGRQLVSPETAERLTTAAVLGAVRAVAEAADGLRPRA